MLFIFTFCDAIFVNFVDHVAFIVAYGRRNVISIISTIFLEDGFVNAAILLHILQQIT